MHQQDAKDVKVKMDLLKKVPIPNANAATMVAIKKMAAGDNIDHKTTSTTIFSSKNCKST